MFTVVAWWSSQSRMALERYGRDLEVEVPRSATTFGLAAPAAQGPEHGASPRPVAAAATQMRDHHRQPRQWLEHPCGQGADVGRVVSSALGVDVKEDREIMVGGEPRDGREPGEMGGIAEVDLRTRQVQLDTSHRERVAAPPEVVQRPRNEGSQGSDCPGQSRS